MLKGPGSPCDGEESPKIVRSIGSARFSGSLARAKTRMNAGISAASAESRAKPGRTGAASQAVLAQLFADLPEIPAFTQLFAHAAQRQRLSESRIVTEVSKDWSLLLFACARGSEKRGLPMLRTIFSDSSPA